MEDFGQFKLNRKERVASFCAGNGFVMPRNFDISQQTYRFVVVNTSSTPPTLISHSGFMESKVIAYITASENTGKTFRIFDFRRFVELHYPGTGNKLTKGRPFDWRSGAPSGAA